MPIIMCAMHLCWEEPGCLRSEACDEPLVDLLQEFFTLCSRWHRKGAPKGKEINILEEEKMGVFSSLLESGTTFCLSSLT